MQPVGRFYRRPHDMPRRIADVGGFVEHHIASLRTIASAPQADLQIHRAELPLPQRVVDAREKALLLLLLPTCSQNLLLMHASAPRKELSDHRVMRLPTAVRATMPAAKAMRTSTFTADRTVGGTNAPLRRPPDLEAKACEMGFQHLFY